jgi:hypothetical protein
MPAIGCLNVNRTVLAVHAAMAGAAPAESEEGDG